MDDDLPSTTANIVALGAALAAAQVKAQHLREEATRLDVQLATVGADAATIAQRGLLRTEMRETAEEVTHLRHEIAATSGATQQSSMFSAGGLTALSTGYLAVRQALGDVVHLVNGMVEGAARAERQATAIRNLGSALQVVQEATRGTIDETMIWETQQRLAQAGIDVTTRQLAGLLRTARDYSLHTGVEMTPAIEKLTSALVSGSERGLRPFDMTLHAAHDNAQRTAMALDVLGQKAETAGAAARTLGEELSVARREMNDSWEALELGAVKAFHTDEALRGLTARVVALADALNAPEMRAAVGMLGRLVSGVMSIPVRMGEGLGEMAAWLTGARPPQFEHALGRGVSGIPESLRRQGAQAGGESVADMTFTEAEAAAFLERSGARSRGGGGGGAGGARSDVMAVLGMFGGGMGGSFVPVSASSIQAAMAEADRIERQIQQWMQQAGHDTGLRGALGMTGAGPTDAEAFGLTGSEREAEAERLRAATEAQRDYNLAMSSGADIMKNTYAEAAHTAASALAGLLTTLIEGKEKADVAAARFAKAMLGSIGQQMMTQGILYLLMAPVDAFTPGLQPKAAAEAASGAALLAIGAGLTAGGAAVQVPSVGSGTTGGVPAAATAAPHAPATNTQPLVINISAFDPDSSARAVDEALRRRRDLGYPEVR